MADFTGQEWQNESNGSTKKDFTQPPEHQKLTRSISRSDSNLLSPPHCESDRPICGRSESLADCVSEREEMEPLSSFASEWDEIERIMTLIAGIEIPEKLENPLEGK
ncbi:hypothetical protein DNTS_021523 [Danionella cerebrum]|uniref:Uncharacterized protein n=1 Tax=Danionella cerebrum TaxID=2873325 RepID=A0A553QI72_9TELE|nr:hypothetical protein DNTS_021523 [Danionella translucida]